MGEDIVQWARKPRAGLARCHKSKNPRMPGEFMLEGIDSPCRALTEGSEPADAWQTPRKWPENAQRATGAEAK